MALNPYTNTQYTPENIEGMVFFSTFSYMFYFIEGGRIFYTDTTHHYAVTSSQSIEKVCEALNSSEGFKIPIYCPDES